MKRFFLMALLLGYAAVCSISAGGVREYKGQMYMVNDWTPTNVQQFLKAGSFDIEGIQVGPEDSTDGVFKNGMYHWGGPVAINSNGALPTDEPLRFRLSDKWQTEDEYYWMSGMYRGEDFAVSETETYTVYGTAAFSEEGNADIEIVYIEPYTEESYMPEPAPTVLAEQAPDERIKRRITIRALPPLPPLPHAAKAFISVHNNTSPTTFFSGGMVQWDASFTDTWDVPAGTTMCTVLVSIKDQDNKIIRALSKKYVPLDKEIIVLSFDDFQEESIELLAKKFGDKPFSIKK